MEGLNLFVFKKIHILKFIFITINLYIKLKTVILMKKENK